MGAVCLAPFSSLRASSPASAVAAPAVIQLFLAVLRAHRGRVAVTPRSRDPQ
ncbi:MAG: hypothetical protein HYZ53_08335 [Planctomycetes bacterium]|nr:hypothetical protein [Planctomycetota bacterium]